MKIISKEVINLDKSVPVYDVINATPHHNFILANGIVSHNCAILDEIEFSKGQSINMIQSSVMKLYRSVKRRMESRYMKRGEMPGMLFLVSSKKSEYDFLEQYAKTVKDRPSTFLVDEPVWNVKPSNNYIGTRFQVAVGNKFMPSVIIPDNKSSEGYAKQGYQVISVPTEYREAFKMDIQSALMDIAGIATVSKSKFMDARRIRANYDENRENPFSTEILTIGIDDDNQIQDFMQMDKIDPRDKAKPGYMHLDLSFSTDKTGISYVVLDGNQKVKQLDKRKGSMTAGTLVDKVDSKYKQIFTIAIQAPSGSEMEIGKVRQFIYFLREQGFNIKQVSADTFQSKDTLQQLKNAGFHTLTQSLDRTPDGYITGRTIINEGRVDMVNEEGSNLERELSEVEQGPNGKVDHPPVETGGCFSSDTKVTLVRPSRTSSKIGDIIDIPFKELTENYDKYRNYKLFSVDENGNKVLSNYKNPHVTKYVDELMEVELENNQIIRCTPDHRFLCKDDDHYFYVEAQHLMDHDYNIVDNKITEKRE